MSRGPTPDASAASPRDLLQSSVGKPLRLSVSYKSFTAPNYGAHDEIVQGRLWAYDHGLDVVVLETGSAGALPGPLRRAAASAAYSTQQRHSHQATTGFKLVQGAHIAQVVILEEDEYAAKHGNHVLSMIANVPVAAMEARDAAATKKCMERAQQIGPQEAGELGQAIFDALSKTYVLYSPRLPCRWHETHIIVLDEVVVVRISPFHLFSYPVWAYVRYQFYLRAELDARTDRAAFGW